MTPFRLGDFVTYEIAGSTEALQHGAHFPRHACWVRDGVMGLWDAGSSGRWATGVVKEITYGGAYMTVDVDDHVYSDLPTTEHMRWGAGLQTSPGMVRHVEMA